MVTPQLLRLILIGISTFLTYVIAQDCTTNHQSFYARSSVAPMVVWDSTSAVYVQDATTDSAGNLNYRFPTYFAWNNYNNHFAGCKPGVCTINLVNTHNSACSSMAGVNVDCTGLISLENQNNLAAGYNLQWRQKDDNGANLVYTLTFTITCTSQLGSLTRTSAEVIIIVSQCNALHNNYGTDRVVKPTTYLNLWITRDITQSARSIGGNTAAPSLSDWLTPITTFPECPQVKADTCSFSHTINYGADTPTSDIVLWSNNQLSIRADLPSAVEIEWTLLCDLWDPTLSFTYLTDFTTGVVGIGKCQASDYADTSTLTFSFGTGFDTAKATGSCFSYSMPQAQKRINFDTFSIRKADGTECDAILQNSVQAASFTETGYFPIGWISSNQTYLDIDDNPTSDALIDNYAYYPFSAMTFYFVALMEPSLDYIEIPSANAQRGPYTASNFVESVESAYKTTHRKFYTLELYAATSSQVHRVQIPLQYFQGCNGALGDMSVFDGLDVCLAGTVVVGSNTYNQCDTTTDSTSLFTYPSTTCTTPGQICEYIDVPATAYNEFKIMLRFSMSVSGVSYVQDLHSSDRLMEFKFVCGREKLSIVPAHKDTYQIQGKDVATVIDFGAKLSYFTTKKHIFWGNSTSYNSTNVFNDRYESDIPFCPVYYWHLYYDRGGTTHFTSSSESVYISAFLASNPSGYPDLGANLAIDRTKPLDHTFYIRVYPILNHANSVYVPIWLKVCGFESIQVSDATTIPGYIYVSDAGLQTIQGSELMTYFSPSNDTDCLIIGFELTDNSDSLYTSGGVQYGIYTTAAANEFLDAGPVDKTLTFTINVMPGDGYLGNKTFLPNVQAVSAGNKKFPRSLNITISKISLDCEAAYLVGFTQDQMNAYFTSKYPLTDRQPKPGLPYYQTDDISMQHPKYVFNNPMIFYQSQDLDSAGKTCNYNNWVSPNNKRYGIINYVVHDPDLNLRKYRSYDFDQYTLELKNNAVPYEYPGDSFISVKDTYETIFNESSYQGFERKFGEDIITKSANYIEFDMSEKDSSKSGWYIFTLKSSFYVDNPSASFKLITLEKDYRFYVDFCYIDSFKDVSAAQTAFGNKTLIQHMLSYGKVEFRSPFKDIIKFEPSTCSEHLEKVVFMDLEYVVPGAAQITGGFINDELVEHIPETVKEQRLDTEGNLIEKEPVEAGETFQLKSIADVNSLFTYDQRAESFTINCEGLYQLGLYEIHMWTYPKQFRAGITYLKSIASSDYDEDWKYSQGLNLTEHRQDFLFYLNVSYDAKAVNDIPHLATPDEGGFEFQTTFNAKQSSTINSYKLPEIKNFEPNEKVSVTISTDALRYVEFSSEDNELVFKPNTMQMTKDVNFVLTLKDDNARNPASTKYTFAIVCTYCIIPMFVPEFQIREEQTIIALEKINFNLLVPKGEVAKPPIMRIKTITSMGILVIEFSKNMNYPTEIKKKFQSDKKQWAKVFEALMEPKDDDAKESRLRQLEEFKDLGYKTDLLTMTAKSNNPLDQDKMNISTYLVALSASRMEFQLHFENPKVISMGSQEEKDQLEILMSPDFISLLKDDEQGLPLDLTNYGNSLSIVKGIPCQLEISAASQEFMQNAQNGGNGMKFVVVMNFAFSFLVTLSLNFLWGMINCLQMIVYLPLFNITLPANVNTLFSILIEIATFDIIPESEQMNQSIFRFKYSNELIQQNSFETIGWETKNFIINSGSLFIFQTMFIFQLIIIAVLRRVAPKYNALIYWYRKFSLKAHIYSIVIRFVLEGFVELFLGSLVNLELMSTIDLLFLNIGDGICFLLSMCYFSFIMCLPLIIVTVIALKINFLENKVSHPLIIITDEKKTKSQFQLEKELLEQQTLLEEEEQAFDSRWNHLYDDLDNDRNLPMQYYFVYVLRRMVFVLIAYYFHECPGIQIMLNNLMMLSLLVFLLFARPFKSPVLNKMEYINECMILQINISLYCLTDWITQTETKIMTGSFIVYTTSFNIFLNVVATCHQIGHIAWREYRKKQYEKALRIEQKIIMKRFSVRKASQIKRAVKTRNQEGVEQYGPQHFQKLDRVNRRRFQQRFIAEYELSDIQEEEGPEQICTEFDRKDGKYLALPKNQNVVAAERIPSKLTTREKDHLRRKLRQRQIDAEDREDDSNLKIIQKMQETKRKQQEEEDKVNERRQQIISQRAEIERANAQIKSDKRMRQQRQNLRRQKNREEQARRADLQMLFGK